MSIAQQAKAARRKARQDLRWHSRTSEGVYIPRRGKSRGSFASVSQRFAAAKNRKRIQAGGRAGSLGFGFRG